MAGWIKDLITDTPFGNIIQNKLQQRETEYANKSRIAGNIAQSVGIQSASKMIQTDPFMVARESEAEIQKIRSKLANKDLYMDEAEAAGQIAGTRASAQKLASMNFETTEGYEEALSKWTKVKALAEANAKLDPEVMASVSAYNDFVSREQAKSNKFIKDSDLTWQQDNLDATMAIAAKKDEAARNAELKQIEAKYNLAEKLKESGASKRQLEEFNNLNLNYQAKKAQVTSYGDVMRSIAGAMRETEKAIYTGVAGAVAGADGTVYDVSFDNGQTIITKQETDNYGNTKKIATTKDLINKTDPNAANQISQIEAAIEMNKRNNPLLQKQTANYQKMLTDYAEYKSEMEAMEYKLDTIVKQTAGNAAQKLGISGNMISSLMGFGDALLSGLTKDEVIKDETIDTPWSTSSGNISDVMEVKTDSDVRTKLPKYLEANSDAFKQAVFNPTGANPWRAGVRK